MDLYLVALLSSIRDILILLWEYVQHVPVHANLSVTTNILELQPLLLGTEDNVSVKKSCSLINRMSSTSTDWKHILLQKMLYDLNSKAGFKTRHPERASKCTSVCK
jgi:hypothetical protein